jgi:hypothetical protein
MNAGIIGVWLIVATLVWFVGVAALVVLGLGSHMEDGRDNGCSGRGCRRDAGWQGSDTTPRRAEPVRGFSPGRE